MDFSRELFSGFNIIVYNMLMPSRNTIKIDIPNSYYHIYARGASKGEIFLEASDYYAFLEFLRRYLSHEIIKDGSGVPYAKLYDDIELLSYCLMSNHFHLLVYQINEGAMPRLMRGIMTSYSRYFNKKYRRSGSLFESRYKASRISNDTYLTHITRYIHLNPKQWRDYPYSSLKYYAHSHTVDWINEKRILDLFSSRSEYLSFVSDYEAIKESLSLIRHELAE